MLFRPSTRYLPAADVLQLPSPQIWRWKILRSRDHVLDRWKEPLPRLDLRNRRRNLPSRHVLSSLYLSPESQSRLELNLLFKIRQSEKNYDSFSLFYLPMFQQYFFKSTIKSVLFSHFLCQLTKSLTKFIKRKSRITNCNTVFARKKKIT